MKDITTLKNRNDVGSWLNQAGLTGVGVEVGSLYGEYAREIMAKWNGKVLHLLDPWEVQSPEIYREPWVVGMDWGQAYESCLGMTHMYPGRISLIRGYSPWESARFADGFLDFVYIDARHDLSAVRADLQAWWPKVKSGGLFSGHDFRTEHNESQCCDVKQAVTEFASANALKIHVTTGPGDLSWWIIKP